MEELEEIYGCKVKIVRGDKMFEHKFGILFEIGDVVRRKAQKQDSREFTGNMVVNGNKITDKSVLTEVECNGRNFYIDSKELELVSSEYRVDNISKERKITFKEVEKIFGIRLKLEIIGIAAYGDEGLISACKPQKNKNKI